MAKEESGRLAGVSLLAVVCGSPTWRTPYLALLQKEPSTGICVGVHSTSVPGRSARAATSLHKDTARHMYGNAPSGQLAPVGVYMFVLPHSCSQTPSLLSQANVAYSERGVLPAEKRSSTVMLACRFSVSIKRRDRALLCRKASRQNQVAFESL